MEEALLPYGNIDGASRLLATTCNEGSWTRMGLLTWRQSADEVCRRIASTKAVLKIVLKIKDDPFMFERWINHHIRIVDFSQIIVFDNESTDTEIFDIYGKIPEDTRVVSFDDFHDHIHSTNRFRKLYDALSASADFAAFLDVDEFLYWCDGTTIRADRGLRDHLSRADKNALFPGLWVQNRDGSLDEFFTSDAEGRGRVPWIGVGAGRR